MGDSMKCSPPGEIFLPTEKNSRRAGGAQEILLSSGMKEKTSPGRKSCLELLGTEIKGSGGWEKKLK
jgi:hypothetical protein